jgi:two-component system sensor histidine kinase KdpD
MAGNVPDDRRPDPDTLLARVQQEELQASRGKLKIFFGASAGVGKTYAMLAAARTAQAQGTALVVGLVETHGRAETEAVAAGLPRLPLKEVTYRDRTLREFDLDAALAWGAVHPGGLVLLDELAHTNAPGSRHPKRWQDILELLDRGIDVWTTVNVQHLESLNDIVSSITGIRVWETVPDRVFDEADEVVVVDLPPDELLERLTAGKVYLPQQAERAIRNFFRKGNLLALRELALRRTADRVDSEMQVFRRQTAVEAVWPNRESLLACIGPDEHGEKVVRSCARLAAQLGVPWHAVHVETPAPGRRSTIGRQHALRVLKLAQELGAVTATLSAPDAVGALVRYARENNLSRLVVGRPERRVPWRRSLADRIAAIAGDLDVLQVAVPAKGGILARAQTVEPAGQPFAWRGYAAALVVCAATALLATPLLGVLELSNIVMLFLLTVLGVGLCYGRGPAVLAAVLGVALFDFFFVPPRFSFAVSDVQYLVTFAVMLVVALVVGQLTAGLKAQADASMLREHRMHGLYEMSRALSAALIPEQVAEIAQRLLTSEFGSRSTLLVPDDKDRLRTVTEGGTPVDAEMAQWVFAHGEAAGPGTDTLPGSGTLMLPLKAPMRTRGVLVVEPGWQGLLSPGQRRLLDTCASLLAISLERIHYIDIARQNIVQFESERLRNSLLSAISHDLRTPLTSLVGLADALGLTKPPPTPEQQEIAGAMKEAAHRMSNLVGNVLEMARLEAGTVQLNRAWQPLEEIVGSALASCKTLLVGRPVDVELAEGLPLLELDAVLMERVLVNLLENATKYTPPGSRVRILARPAGDHVVIDIDDEGPGLPKGSEERIFEKFERGNREDATAGVGLGLAICRAIVLAHGGRIRAENRLVAGRLLGARFEITLPVGTPPVDDGTNAGNDNQLEIEQWENRTPGS